MSRVNTAVLPRPVQASIDNGLANAMLVCDNGPNEVSYVFVTLGSRRLSISLDIIIDEILVFCEQVEQVSNKWGRTHW